MKRPSPAPACSVQHFFIMVIFIIHYTTEDAVSTLQLHCSKLACSITFHTRLINIQMSL